MSQRPRMEEVSLLAVSDAKAKGATLAKAVVSSSREQKMVCENSQFSLAQSVERQGCSLWLVKDHKKGTATLNSWGGQDIRCAVRSAAEIASFSIPDQDLCLAKRSEAGEPKELDFLYDESLEDISAHQLGGLLETALATFARYPKISVDRMEISAVISEQLLRTSQEILRSEQQSTLNWSYMGFARDGEEVSGFDYDSGASYQWGGAVEKMQAQIEQLCQRLQGQLHAKKGPSYKGMVVLTPRAVGELFLRAMMYHASGSQVMDGRSKWAKSIGEEVMSPLITITDQPHLRELGGATSYDADGVATQTRKLIDAGKLTGHFHSCYTAKKTNSKINALAGGPFGLVIDQGKSNLTDLLAMQKEILLVDRFSGNIDSLTGDFSGVAKSSVYYSGGERAFPATETMISGNLMAMMKAVVAVSQEQQNVSDSMLAPYLLVDGVNVVSGN